MTTALWIIAVCEIVRLVQNTIQLLLSRRSVTAAESATAAKDYFDKALDELIKEIEASER